MRRRIHLLLAAFVCVALTSASPAYAQEPTIVTDITFPEEGEPFGTFTATAPLCPSGTFVDEFIGGGGAFRSGHVDYGSATVLKTFTCSDNSGTFMILFHPQFSPATPDGCAQAGPFAVGGGTGAYTELRGHGDFCLLVEGENFTETFTGRFSLG
jgi:hypothetical protein